ncbi:ester cyclase [Sphaerisporangium viridialbum]|uniref:ester cyclase n=1 Tax=Sphaerisporangium viridialbum TaxID=46189 RepID=UPI003C76CC69
MDVRKIAEAHLSAWQAGDAAAVAASAASYSDPDSGGALSGDALEAHAAGVLARFKQLRFLVDRVTGDDGAATFWWTLQADHRAPYLGMPAVGGAVSVTGTDLVTLGEDGVHVRRCFDRLAVAEALGYSARFVPEADEVREFGTSARATAGRTERPGALTLTWLEVRDDAEAADVDLLSVEIVKSLSASKGFLGVATFDIGDRKFTLSAFDRPESVRAVHARPHQRAMRRFFKSGLCTRAFTSVWLPSAVRDYARCPNCGGVVKVGEGAACGCGWVPEDVSLL